MANLSEAEFRDRDLLFGAFALQFSDVSPQQLYSATLSDRGSSSVDVAEALVSAGALSQEDKERISGLVDRVIERHGGDVDAAVSSVSAATSFLQASKRGSSGATRAVHKETVATPNPDFLDESLPGILEWPDRYSSIREHGRGGFGRVLVAYDKHLEREVAIKELLAVSGEPVRASEMTQSTAERSRFLREARITSQLEHPSIVPIYELAHRADGSVYYTMKFVRGRTLSQAIQEATTLEERLRLLPHFIDLCQAIAYAHSRGVIHRDIKPGNVMIGEYGETVVLDWGLAKNKRAHESLSDSNRETVAGDAPGAQSKLSQTQYGKALGTPQFMPPEQAEGRLEEIDERSDVYALGIVLYELMSGTLPFDGTTISEVLWKVVNQKPRSLLLHDPSIPPEIAAICDRAIVKDRSRRYGSAGELANEIVRFQSGALVQSYDYRTADLVRRFIRRHVVELTLAGAALALFALLGTYSYVVVVNERNAAVASEQLATSARQRAVESEQDARNAQSAAEVSESEAIAARAQAQRELYHASISLANSYANLGAFDEARYQLAACPEEERNWEWGWLAFKCNQDWLSYEAPPPNNVTDGPSLVLAPESGLIARRDPRGDVRVTRRFSGAHIGLHHYIRAQHFAGSGSILLTQDGNILRAFDTATQELLFDAPYVSIGPWSVSVSADSQHIAFPTSLQSIQVRGVRDTQATAECSGHYTISAVLSADGSLLACGGHDLPASMQGAGEIEIRRVATCELQCTVPSSDLSRMAFSPDGRYLATPLDGAVVLYESETGVPMHRLGPFPGRVATLAWNPESTQIVVADSTGDIAFWDVHTGARSNSVDHSGEVVQSCRFDANGERLLTGTNNGAVYLWDSTGTELHRVFRGHAMPIEGLYFLPQGELIASRSEKSLRIWNTAPDGIISGKATRVVEASITPDGDGLLYSSPDGRAWRQDLDRMSESPTPVHTRATSGRSSRVSNSSRFLLEPGAAGLQLHDLAGEVQETLEDTGDYNSAPAAFSHNDQYLAVLQPRLSSDLLRVAMYDLGSGVPDKPMHVHEQLVDISELNSSPGNLAFRPSDNMLAVAIVDYLILIDPASGRPVDSFPIPGLEDRADVPFEFDSRGQFLAYANNNAGITVIDFEDRDKPRSIPTQGKEVTALAFSPDGERLVSGISDGGVRIWNLRTGRETLPLPEQAGAIRYLGFRSSGLDLVAASTDEIRLIRAFPWRPDDLSGDKQTPVSDKLAHVKAVHPQTASVEARCHAKMHALGSLKRTHAAAEGVQPGADCPADAGVQALVEHGCPTGGEIALNPVGIPPSCELHGTCNTTFYREILAQELDNALAASNQAVARLIEHELSVSFLEVPGNMESETKEWLDQDHYQQAIVAAASGFLKEHQSRRITRLRGYAAMSIGDYALAASDIASLAPEQPHYASAAAFALAMRGDPGDIDDAYRFLRQSLEHFNHDEYTDRAHDLIRDARIADTSCSDRVHALYNLDTTAWRGLDWQSDAEQVRAQSEQNGMNVLALFHTENSYYSRRLLEETISRVDIQERMIEHYLLLSMDDPHDHPLANALDIRTYPTIVAVDSYGQILARSEGLVRADEFNATFLGPCYDVGRIRGWNVLGPFPAESEDPLNPSVDFDAAIDHNREFHNDAGPVQWMRAPGTTLSAHLELNRLYLSYEERFAYLHRSFTLQEPEKVRLEFSFDDAGTIWIDGELILERDPQPDGAIHYADANVQLDAGHHELLVRVENGRGGMIAIGAMLDSDRDPISHVEFTPLNADLPLLLLSDENTSQDGEQQVADVADEIHIRIEKDNILQLWRREWDEYGWTLLTRLGIQPVQDESGKVYGIQGANLSRVPLCNKLGLRDGDIVLSVNGIGPEHGLNYAAYQDKIRELEDARLEEFTAEIIRAGRRTKIIYSVDY